MKLPDREESEPLWLPERSARPLPERRGAPLPRLLPPLPPASGPAMCGLLPRPNLLPGAMPSVGNALRRGAHQHISMAYTGLIVCATIMVSS